MTLFGREAHFPVGRSDWLELLGLLAIIAVVMLLVSGWSTALLGVSVGFASYLYDHHLFISAVIALTAVIAFALGARAGQAPAGWRAAKEVALLSAGFVVYEWGRTQVIGSFDQADANAQRIMAFERRIGLAIEEPFQQFVVRHDALVYRFNWIYSFAFLSFVLGVVFYLYVSDERIYRVYRTSLGIAALLALITIALVPTAPPRLAVDSGV